MSNKALQVPVVVQLVVQLVYQILPDLKQDKQTREIKIFIKIP